MCGTAYNQKRFFDEVYTRCSRVRCGTVRFRLEIFVKICPNCTLSGVCYGSLYTMKFIIVSAKTSIIVSNPTEVMAGISHFQLKKIIDSEIYSTLVIRAKAHSQILILKYTKKLHVQWGVLRLILNNKSAVVRLSYTEVSVVCCSSHPKDLVHGFWCVALLLLKEVCNIIFPLYKRCINAFISVGKEVVLQSGFRIK